MSTIFVPLSLLTAWSGLQPVRLCLVLPDRPCALRRDGGSTARHHSCDSIEKAELCEWDIVIDEQLKQEPRFSVGLMVGVVRSLDRMKDWKCCMHDAD